MPGRSQSPQSPHPPSSQPSGTPENDALATQSDPLPDDESIPGEISPEFADSAQPHEQDGVTEDMATLAVNPGVLEGVTVPSVAQGSSQFLQMEDSAIMQELRAGNM